MKILNKYLWLVEGSSCVTAFDGDGHCKNALNCQWLQDAQIKESDWTVCDNSWGITLVCCKDPLEGFSTTLATTTTTKTTTTTTSTTTTAKPEDGFLYNRIFYTEEQCEELTQESTRLKNIANMVEPIESIANGTNAEPRELPFVVVIYTYAPDANFTCTGSIISKR